MDQLKKTIAVVVLSAAGICAAGAASAQGSGGPEASYQMHIDPSYRTRPDTMSSSMMAATEKTKQSDAAKMQMAKAQAASDAQARRNWYQGH